MNRDAPICFTDFLGAVKTSTISGVPSGTYTINSSDFSDGSNPTLSDGSTLVYDGSGTNFTLTGLTPGTTYFVKVFTRLNSTFSSGIENDENTGVVPSVGDFIISEVTDGNTGSFTYLELYNLTASNLSLNTCKVIRAYNAGVADLVFDLDSEGSGDRTIPANGFYVISKNTSRADFESSYGPMNATSVNFLNSGNECDFNNEGRRWIIRCGGLPNTNDGVIIDDLGATKGQRRDYQYSKGNWVRTSDLDPNKPRCY